MVEDDRRMRRAAAMRMSMCLCPLCRTAQAFFWGDACALALVLGGFVAYQWFSAEGRAARAGHAVSGGAMETEKTQPSRGVSVAG